MSDIAGAMPWNSNARAKARGLAALSHLLRRWMDVLL